MASGTAFRLAQRSPAGRVTAASAENETTPAGPSPSGGRTRQRRRPSGAAGSPPVLARPSAVPAGPAPDRPRGPAQPLGGTLLETMGRAFAADFRAVRIHRDSPDAARLGAEAYTRGSDIHVAPGLWAPGTSRGQALLGHELAHVVQQREGRVPGQRGGAAVDATPALEREAEERGTAAARGARLPGAGTAGPTAAAAPGGVATQCRLPAWNYKKDLFEYEPQDKDANLEGIRKLLVRLYYFDLNDQQRKDLQETLLKAKVDLGQALKQPGEQTEHLYNWVVHLFGTVVYPGPQLQEPKPDDAGYAALTKRTLDVFGGMLDHNEGFAEVFGTAAEEARTRVAKAAEAFKRLIAGKQIVIDQSGESDEMMKSGHSSPGGPIILRGTGSFANTAANVATLVHETMHHTFAEILDNGGYPANADDFRQRPDQVKVLNAAHYEEVARRVLGADAGALGGKFVPAVQQQEGKLEFVDTRTPAQRAADSLRTMVRTAWIRAQNVHGFLKFQMDHNDLKLWPAVLRWSEILGLQIHQRKPRQGNQYTFINYVDLLQVESITKTLGQMLRTDLDGIMKQDLSSEEQYKKAMLAYLVDRFKDNTWLTEGRLAAIIGTLADAPENPGEVKL